MRNNHRFSALFLAVLLLVQLLPSAALAAKWQPNADENDDPNDFLFSTHCDQFTVGVDSNHFEHSDNAFENSYILSQPYLEKIMDRASYPERCSVIEQLRKSWSGSCNGIANSMVFAKLSSSDGWVQSNTPVRITDFQPDARCYFDLLAPLQNRANYDLINYYVYAQILSVFSDHRHFVDLNEPTFQESELRAFVVYAMNSVDSGKPFVFSFWTADGGHSIVCLDYYLFIDSAGLTNYVFKFYDENDFNNGQDVASIPYCYLWLKKLADDSFTSARTDTTTGETVYYLEKTDGSTRETLSALSYDDSDRINEAVNPHNPAPASHGATDPELYINNINESYSRLFVKPFTGVDPNTGATDYINDYAKFIKIKTDLLPYPMSVEDSTNNTPFAHMSSSRYINTAAVNSNVDLELSLKTADGSGNPFAGYDVTSTGGNVSFSMSKVTDASNGTGNYASVVGNDLALVRFLENGSLDFVTAQDGGGSAELNYGVSGDYENYDMTSLYMPDFTYLEIYEGAGSDGSLVLKTDALTRDGLDLQFFKGALESAPLGYISDDGTDVWIQIKSEIIDGVVEVSVYSVDHLSSTGFPVFHDYPDDTTIIDRPILPRTQSSSGGATTSSESYGSRSEYSLSGGQSSLSWNGGALRFTVDAPAKDYVSTSLDGVPLESRFVKIEEGSTVVTIAAEALSSLKTGAHTLRVQFKNGFMLTTLNVEAPSASAAAVADVPATGAPLFLAPTLLVVSLAFFVLALRRREK